MNISLKTLIEHCLQSNTGFASYKLPHEFVPVTMVAGDSVLCDENTIKRDIRPGFIVAPFDKAMLPLIKIIPNITLEGTTFNKSLLNKIQKCTPHKKEVGISKEYGETLKKDYFPLLKQIQEQIASGKTGKIVLSVISQEENLSNSQIASLYLSLINLYPNAFVYILNTGQTGIWIGATPEVLISANGKNFDTMALAGTMPLNKTSKASCWSQKEMIEHEYVRSFIKEKLNTLGLQNIYEGKTETMAAGKIAHLKTSFKGELSGISPLEIASKLHPTPAICGTPTEKAKNIILEYEKHNRGYYTGYLGPVNQKEKTQLYVNLRCAKINHDRTLLFAGGGIVENSDPKKEWEEIQLKMNTIKHAIQKVRSNENTKKQKYAS